MISGLYFVRCGQIKPALYHCFYGIKRVKAALKYTLQCKYTIKISIQEEEEEEEEEGQH